mgnify:FL=1
MSYLKNGNTVFEDKDIRILQRSWATFVKYGCKPKHFTERLYDFLCLCTGFIAHYNRGGFYSYYFNRNGASIVDDMKRSAEDYNRWPHLKEMKRGEILKTLINMTNEETRKVCVETIVTQRKYSLAPFCKGKRK